MRPEKTPDYQLAVTLATEGRLTMGEIADRIGWPRTKSLRTLVAYVEHKLPARRRVRGFEDVGPVFRQVRRF